MFLWSIFFLYFYFIPRSKCVLYEPVAPSIMEAQLLWFNF